MHVRAVLAIAVLAACTPARHAPPEAASGSGRLSPTRECFRAVAGVLADDSLQGRGVGSPGLDLAAEFLARRFVELELSPGTPNGYLQHFEVVTGVARGPDNRLEWTRAQAGTPPSQGERESGTYRTDFVPLALATPGAFSGSVVFAGYGIRAPELGYDDYAGLEVSGRVVLAFRFEPQEDDAESPFQGRRASRWSDARHKAHVAREAGAAALILVQPPGEEDARLPRLRRQGAGPGVGLPVLEVRTSLVAAWLAGAGLDLAALHAEIDRELEPRSFPVPGLVLSGQVDTVATRAVAANVIGVLPGSGALADEAVVVGAHYDHLGLGGPGSMRPDETAIHNGADDNASGVAALVCAIGGLREAELDTERRTLVAIGFSAEETSLAGSSYYVRHPAVPLERTLAMVNLDMVGRLRESRVWALGTDSAPEWTPLVTDVAQALDLKAELGGDGYAPSDQLPFYDAGVPVLQLFTGAHPEYHTPDDDLEHLELDGGARVASLLAGILEALLERGEPLTFVASSRGSPLVGDRRGYGAWLGTVPDFAEMLTSEAGVRISAVRPGGPAERAGLLAGDRIVELAGVEIRTLYDLTYVLRDHRPGDVVTIEVLRDGDSERMGVTLGNRADARPGALKHGSPRD